MAFDDNQVRTLVALERSGSIISILSVFSIFICFASFRRLRTVSNTFVVFASLANVIASGALLISYNGLDSGAASSLCQAQAFLIEVYVFLGLPSLGFIEGEKDGLLMAFHVILQLRPVRSLVVFWHGYQRVPRFPQGYQPADIQEAHLDLLRHLLRGPSGDGYSLLDHPRQRQRHRVR